jgi:hypothetical protein
MVTTDREIWIIRWGLVMSTWVMPRWIRPFRVYVIKANTIPILFYSWRGQSNTDSDNIEFLK